MMSLSAIRKQWADYLIPNCQTLDKNIDCSFCSSPNSVILNCDAIKTAKNISGNLNDCLIFEQSDKLYIGVIDLKGKNYKPRHTRDQLIGGADLACKILKDIKKRSNYEIYLIVVANSHPHAHLKKIFKKEASSNKKQSPLGKKQYRFRTAKCHCTFSSARKLPMFR